MDARPVPVNVLNATSTTNDIVAYVSLLRKARGHMIAHMICAKMSAPSPAAALAAAASADGEYMTVAKSTTGVGSVAPPEEATYMKVSHGFNSGGGSGTDTSEYVNVAKASQPAAPAAPPASHEDKLF